MNIQPSARLDKPAFLDWVQRQEGRFELVKGRVVMMVGASRAHGVIVSNLVVTLRDRLDPQNWSVIADFGLDTEPETLRYPDIVVDRANGAAGDYTATAPVLLAEVLSSSTAGIDLGDKAAEYLKLPGLAAYLVFAQDEAKAWAWVRSNEGFSPGPTVLSGADAAVEVPVLQLRLPLAEVYREVAMA